MRRAGELTRRRITFSSAAGLATLSCERCTRDLRNEVAVSSVRIPARFRAPLERLATANAAERAGVREALRQAPPFSSSYDLEAAVAEGAQIEDDDAKSIIWALLSFASQLDSWEGESGEVARDAARSNDLALDEDARVALTELLTELVTAEGLLTSAKASDVITEHEHMFSGVRVLTDLRPIFGEEASAEPAGMAIMSTMKIGHYTNGRERSLYLALDAEDLKQVRDAIDRALDKTESLRELMRDANLPIYRTESKG